MRGKEFDDGQQKTIGRITPAYAGKSHGENSGGCKRWDHPRLCGEKKKCSVEIMRLKGSPPPMRGKAVPDTVVSYGSRITPAYAGKSAVRPLPHATPEDHPRLCGEK